MLPQLCPHSYLSLTHAQREVMYKDLTMEEFVAGYGQILHSPDVTELESSSRFKHLVSLMYFTKQYEWHVGISWGRFTQNQMGLVNWGDSFFHLESRTLCEYPKSATIISTRVARTPKITMGSYVHGK